MLNIYIARHGQDEDNVNGILNGHRDMPLTLLGEKQANDLAEKIKALKITFERIYSSPLRRAYKTALKVSSLLKMAKPEVMYELIEREFGIMTGKSHTDIEKYCGPNILKTETVTYFLSPEGAETFPQLIERGKIVLEKVNRNHKDGNVLLVCHGDIGKMIYAAYYNLNWQDFLPKFHFGNSDLLLMSKTSSAEAAHIHKTEQNNL